MATANNTSFAIRTYQPADAESWLRCRALSFLNTQYYDDVKTERTPLTDRAITLVATANAAPDVIGLLDIEVDGAAATIDTIAIHPDHQRAGIATGLLHAAAPLLKGQGVSTLDAWTREDVAANSWYQRTGFREQFRYLHVYLGYDEDKSGFTTPDRLQPITAFMHGRIEDEPELRARFRRIYVCRQYLRDVTQDTLMPAPPA